ncbi:MAG: Rab family GTPase [Candidatus Hodarchaeota archaeon]
MELIKGLIFSIFDEKLGPTAASWLPESMDEDMREDVAITVMNITSNMQEMPTALAMIPLPVYNSKSLAKFIMFKDDTRRGGIGSAALIMLYDEANDAIFYKYFKQFEDVFDKYAKMSLALLNIKAGEEQHAETLGFLSDDLKSLLDVLKKEEMSSQATEAFPGEEEEGDAEACLPFKMKIAICGDGNVGKTSLVIQFTEKAFRSTYLPTIGVNITEKSVYYGKNCIKFVLWDIAGQAKFTTVRKHFYTGAQGVILIFDLTNPQSLGSITGWYSDVKKTLGDSFNGVVLGNKCDLKEERAVSDADAQELASSLGMPYFETSAKTGENVDAVFDHFSKKFIN